jgi:hypothetical protein
MYSVRGRTWVGRVCQVYCFEKYLIRGPDLREGLALDLIEFVGTKHFVGQVHDYETHTIVRIRVILESRMKNKLCNG